MKQHQRRWMGAGAVVLCGALALAGCAGPGTQTQTEEAAGAPEQQQALQQKEQELAKMKEQVAQLEKEVAKSRRQAPVETARRSAPPAPKVRKITLAEGTPLENRG